MNYEEAVQIYQGCVRTRNADCARTFEDQEEYIDPEDKEMMLTWAHNTVGIHNKDPKVVGPKGVPIHPVPSDELEAARLIIEREEHDAEICN